MESISVAKSAVKLFYFHTPELVPATEAPDCAIAIDVLRATSTIATALNAGAEAVQVFSDLDALRTESEAWPADRRLRAGERGGKQVEGFDFGNSPLEVTPERFRDRRLFISTTNGTRSLTRIQQAKTVIAAALVNRQAVVDFLKQEQPETVWIVGSGWEGSYALEDSVCAGAIAAPLQSQIQLGNDEMLAAIALYQRWEHNLYGLLCQASHGQRLLRLKCEADLDYCSRVDILQVLPKQREPGVLMAAPRASTVQAQTSVA
nr:2-phosphosulfolactate phosphatase family protein [Synechococcus elongatus PCC 11801]